GRPRVIGRRELEVPQARSACLQELDLNLTDAPADLEHGRVLHPTQLEKLEHPPRGCIEPFLAIALCHPASKTRREERVTAPRIAAARPGESLEHLRRYNPRTR